MSQRTVTIPGGRGSHAPAGTNRILSRRRLALPFGHHVAVRALAILAGSAFGFLAFGYTILLRHLDPEEARRAVEQRLEYGVLAPDEAIQERVPISRRSGRNYFRSSHGELVVTDRRLLLLVVDPPHAGAELVERIVVSVREVPKDTTVTLEADRAMLGLDHRLVIATASGRRGYTVPDDQWLALEGAIANVAARHDEQYAAAAALRAAAETAREARLAAERSALLPIYYRVVPGDALFTIARRFDTTPERIRELNGLTGDRIRAGDTLLVRAGAGDSLRIDPSR